MALNEKFIQFSLTEIDVKRGPAIHTLTPTPRRRSDPEFLKWDSEVNAMLDDDYEGKEHFSFHIFLLKNGQFNKMSRIVTALFFFCGTHFFPRFCFFSLQIPIFRR